MQSEDRHSGRTLAYLGLAMMSVLIGSAVLLGTLYGNPGAIYYPYPFAFSFYWFWPMFGLFFSTWDLGSIFSWPWRTRYMDGGRRWRDPSYEILRERFARGEITRDQFEQMRRDLEST